METLYKLLIIDDETEILSIYKDYFSKRGAFEVEVTPDSEEGLEKLRSEDFDVAIVDIKMPKMSGVVLAKKVYEEELDTEIIFLTGEGDKKDAVDAINYDVAAWFEKEGIEMKQIYAKALELAKPVSVDEALKYLLSDFPEAA